MQSEIKKTNLEKLLIFLSGKKGTIAGIIGLVIAYLAVKSIIGEAEVILFSGLNVLLFGGVSIATKKLIYKY